jgi:hypothetical protein
VSCIGVGAETLLKLLRMPAIDQPETTLSISICVNDESSPLNNKFQNSTAGESAQIEC